MEISDVPFSCPAKDRPRATLRLEPVGGGGDVQKNHGKPEGCCPTEGPLERGNVVAAELIEQVLPDLYLAVDPGPRKPTTISSPRGEWANGRRSMPSSGHLPRSPCRPAIPRRLGQPKALPFRSVKRREDPPTGGGNTFWTGSTYLPNAGFSSESSRRIAQASGDCQAERVRGNNSTERLASAWQFHPSSAAKRKTTCTDKVTGDQTLYRLGRPNGLTEVKFENNAGQVTSDVQYTYDVDNRWIGETVTTYATPGGLSRARLLLSGNSCMMEDKSCCRSTATPIVL